MQASSNKVLSACQRCRRQKLKCDTHRPCTLCIRAGARCLPGSTTRWRPYQPTAAPSLRRRQQQDEAAQPHQKVIYDTAQHPDQVSEPARVNEHEDSWKSSSMLSLVDGAFHLHHTNVPQDRTTTALPGSYVRQESPLATDAQGGLSRSSLGRDTPSSTRQYLHGFLSLPTTELLSLMPPFDAASLLVDTYFDRVHWFMLIFQQDEFRRRWPKLYQRQPGRAADHSSNAAFLSTFLVVIAIGLHYVGPYRQALLVKHGVDSSLKDRILSTVKAKLLDVMSLGSLEAAQTCVLLGTYYLYHGSPRLAWPVCGCGLRIAQALHLHHRLRLPGSPHFRQQYETRKRCWWAIYEIETFSAVVYGYPHSIRDADCDVEPLDPSAKLHVVQSPSTFDEPLACQTTLLSYKYFMSKLSVITKAALNELYRTKSSPSEDETFSRSRLDLQDTLRAVAKYNGRLQQWRTEVPLDLQWDHVAGQANYSSPEEIDCDIGASGPRFQNHIYQLQALALMLAFENAMILTHRPLLSYRMRNTNEAGVLPDNSGRADSSTPNSFASSLEACRAAALRMSSIQSSPVVKLVAETYAVTFVSIHTFTAGITLGILCSMDPLNPQSSISKVGLQRAMETLEDLRSRSVVAEQGVDILQRLTQLVIQKELDVMLGKGKRAETSLSSATTESFSYASGNEPQALSKSGTSPGTVSGDIIQPDHPTVDIASNFATFHFTPDPALTDALHDFDQALLSYAPQPEGGAEETAENPFLWPPTLDGFPILEQTWMWDLENDAFAGEEVKHP